MYSTAEEDAKKALPADMSKMTTSTSTTAEQAQQQTEPDESPTQDAKKKDLEEEDETNQEAHKGDDSLPSDVRTTIMKKGEIDEDDL